MDFPEGGSSVSQYGDEKAQGELTNTEKSTKVEPQEHRLVQWETDFGPLVKGFPATLTQLDTMLHNEEDVQYFQ